MTNSMKGIYIRTIGLAYIAQDIGHYKKAQQKLEKFDDKYGFLNEDERFVTKIFINGKEAGLNPSSIYFSSSKQNYAYTVNIAGKNYL